MAKYSQHSSGLILPHFSTGSSGVAKIGNLSLYAKNGIICLSHDVDGKEDFTQMTVETAIERCKAIEEDMIYLRKLNTTQSREMAAKHAKFLEIMNEVVHQARTQGSPNDASATRDKIRRRKKSISVSKPLTYGDLKQIDRETNGN